MSDIFHQMSSYQHYRIRRHAKDWQAPVTIICGFLGSGKTTTVNRLLRQDKSGGLEILIREHCVIAIDDRLVDVDPKRVHVSSGVSEHIDEETMLYMAMDRLHEERFEKFERLILETSGAEDPEMFRHLFFLWDMPKMYRLGSFVTLVDAEYGDLNLDEFPFAAEQIAYADVILLNKVDLADAEKIEGLERRIRKINAAAKIYRTTYGDIPFEKIADTPLYEQIRDLHETGIEEVTPSMDNIKSYILEETAPMDKAKVNEWINKLFNEHGKDILRSKGFLNFTNEDYRYEFQAVRKTFHSYAHDIWPSDEERKSVLVFIGNALPP